MRSVNSGLGHPFENGGSIISTAVGYVPVRAN